MTCHYKRACTQHGSVLLPETFEQLGPQVCAGIDVIAYFLQLYLAH